MSDMTTIELQPSRSLNNEADAAPASKFRGVLPHCIYPGLVEIRRAAEPLVMRFVVRQASHGDTR